jgi:hypothetical protein
MIFIGLAPSRSETVTNISVAKRHQSKRRVVLRENCLSMRYPLTAMRPVIRRLTAALMVLVVILAALVGTLASASATTRGQTNAAELSNMDRSAPKPCSKAVLPGTVSPCPFAGVSLTGLPAAERMTERPLPAIQVLRWRSGKTAFASQCGTSSPYRPPCHLS